MSGPEKSRSVVDFDSDDALRKALMAMANDATESMSAAAAASANGEEPSDTPPTDQNLDWVLPSFDPETTEVQSMKEELHRLLVLKSYLILDGEREEAFDRITGLASKFFDVPIALVSLVDLGRQWFMSNRGLGSVRETPRKDAFCAHAILNKHNILIVPDATKDFRFRDNPLVTGPPNIRFYAGAPLLCPEGYKLGTLCIIDNRIRSQGLTPDEQDALHDLADMTIQLMVDRRYRLQTRENPAQLIAYTAHDLMTPLTGVQLSLSLLKDDEDVQRQLSSHHLELIKTAANCSDLMIRICQTVIKTLRKEDPASLTAQDMDSGEGAAFTVMVDLVKSLLMILEPIPKPVPLIITLDPQLPVYILSDDLKLFRSALNLVSHAMSRTKLGYVHLKIHAQQDKANVLFECVNTGVDVAVEEYQYLFQPSRTEDGILHLGLSSVASLINSLNGQYGFRAAPHIGGRKQTGSVFWFSVPLFQAESGGNESVAESQTASTTLPVLPLLQRAGSSTNLMRNASASSMASRRASLAIEDILQVDRLNAVFAPTVNTNTPTERKMSAISSTVNGGPEVSGSRKRRALVIDDSLVVRKSLAFALKKLDFEVTLAKDGMEGFACLKDQMFDITLCDFLMPVMDGMDCVKQYREWEEKNRPSFKQLIVGISAHANANDHGQGLKAGMEDFKPKPISIEDLTEMTISDVARKRSKQLDTLEGCTSVASSHVVDGEPMDTDPSASSKRAATEALERSAKRVRAPSVDFSHESTSEPVCLIATDTPTMESNTIAITLESNGWQVVIVHDGQEVLRLLQIRNWDAVLIDDKLPMIPGTLCITGFREWEQINRVNKQKNMLLVVEGDIPSPDDKASVIQPPHGVDGVLRNPVQWKDLEVYVKKSKKDGSLGIVVRGHD